MKDLFSVSIIQVDINNNKLNMFTAYTISMLNEFLNKIPTDVETETNIFFHHYLINEGFTLKIYGNNSYVYTKSDILNSRFDEDSIKAFVVFFELCCHSFDNDNNTYEDIDNVDLFSYFYDSKNNIGIERVPIKLIY
jgi:hypothetical protein